jgi:predicted nucleic acid-binding protein
MATYLLDTTVIIDAINGKKNRNLLLIGLAEGGHTLACCPVNIAEVYAGLRPKEEERTAALLHSLQLYAITLPVAELAGRLKHDCAGKAKAISLADAMIAAVALHYQLTLITDNTKDFPMDALSLHTFPES